MPVTAPRLVEEKAAHAKDVIRHLKKVYPNAHCELNFGNPLELLVATILSAQANDKQVNIVTESLFKKYRTAADYANAPLAELENDLRAIGLYRSKAKNIKACCRRLIEQHDGEVPRSMEELVALDGVGRKTANVVLGNAYGINAGIVVDTHVMRLSRRLGLSEQKTAEKIESELMNLVPKRYWAMFSHWLIWHGRRRCYARNPNCPHCELALICPSAGMCGNGETKG